MKKIAYLLATMLLSINAFASSPDFAKIFHGKAACFILHDLQANKTVIEYNHKRCSERVFACSTFKIPIAIMAFDQSILHDENSLIKWDGVDRDFASWNRDQTPKTWLRDSTVWVSQWLTPQIGMNKIKDYLAEFSYGNQDMSGGITKAWLSSSLKISATEQIQFLKNFWQEKLPVSKRAILLTKKSLPIDVLPNGDIINGKTGSGFLDGRDKLDGRRVGWFVGHFVHANRDYVFATSMSDIKGADYPKFNETNSNKLFVKKAIFPGGSAKALTEQILTEFTRVSN